LSNAFVFESTTAFTSGNNRFNLFTFAFTAVWIYTWFRTFFVQFFVGASLTR
jgi:hypothetical protein